MEARPHSVRLAADAGTAKTAATDVATPALTLTLTGTTTAFDGRLELAPADIFKRKFIVRRAPSSAFAMILAEREARSVVTGKVIPIDDYMSEFTASHFVSIFPLEVLKEADEDIEQRVVANMLLGSESDRNSLKQTSASELLITNALSSGEEVRTSQLISKKTLLALITRKLGGIPLISLKRHFESHSSKARLENSGAKGAGNFTALQALYQLRSQSTPTPSLPHMPATSPVRIKTHPFLHLLLRTYPDVPNQSCTPILCRCF